MIRANTNPLVALQDKERQDQKIVYAKDTLGMNDNELSLKPINELLKETFFIPAYQRGYRWTTRQVEDLLNDIREFQRESESKNKEAFYCLQPLVVRQTDGTNEWELIDGQQRLTTIYLILIYLKDIVNLLGKSPYNLRYETREDSGTFLKAIDLDKKERNIDYFHICNAYEAIKAWFDSQDGTYKIKFIQTLLNDDDTGKNVKVIWYNIKESIDPVEVFTRLNIGKIPLTNAELVKALFLRSRNFSDSEITLQQLKIAHEWDTIEKALQSDEFWYFLDNEDRYSNRIEFVLKMIADSMNNASDAKHDHYHTFIAFNRELNKPEVSAETHWSTIKTYFMTLEEWFRDRYSYHLIGYLINQGVPIPVIKQESESENTKTAFRLSLKDYVFKTLFGKNECLSLHLSRDDLQRFISDKLNDWSYGSDRIKPTLLLFNISTLLRSRKSNFRFQFDSYKTEHWDIEHVRSVKSEKPDRADLQKAWIRSVVEYVTGLSQPEEQAAFVSRMEGSPKKQRLEQALLLFEDKVFNTDSFDALYEHFLTEFNEDVERETDNSIGNLALLDAGTNRSYKNSVFPIKRERILSLDKSVKFVPVCTKNVFLKYYSSKIGNMMFWGEDDRDEYQSAIVDNLVWFFWDEKGETL